MGHNTEKSTLARVWKTEDLAHSGREWHSPAFDLLDKQHPAVTGHNHPAAVKGAAAGHSLTSQMQEGTGQLDRLKAEHGKTEGERLASQSGRVHGSAETGTHGVRAENINPSHGTHGSHGTHTGSNVLPTSTHYTGATSGYPVGQQTGVTSGYPVGQQQQGAGGVFDPATGTYSAPAAAGYQAGFQDGAHQSGRAL
jgi:hypothetical protein